jgi:hypothetical protein
MITLYGQNVRHCDGLARRDFLRIGALGTGAAAFNLVDLNRAEAAQAQAGKTVSRHKAVINVFLGGGPPHQDMWDLKPEAPTEIRGEFKPISTSVCSTAQSSVRSWVPLVAMTQSNACQAGHNLRWQTWVEGRV